MKLRRDPALPDIKEIKKPSINTCHKGGKMIYDYTIKTGKGGELNLADYKGKVIMVVNTATGCGFTPQYEPIEKMYRNGEFDE